MSCVLATLNPVTDRTLVAQLVASISPSLPQGFTLEPVGDGIVIRRADDPVGAHCHFSDLVMHGAEGALTATLNLLDLVQDYISISTSEPWPRSTASARGDHIPHPEVEVVDGVLKLWFGSRDEPAIRFRSIPLGGGGLDRCPW